MAETSFQDALLTLPPSQSCGGCENDFFNNYRPGMQWPNISDYDPSLLLDRTQIQFNPAASSNLVAGGCSFAAQQPISASSPSLQFPIASNWDNSCLAPGLASSNDERTIPRSYPNPLPILMGSSQGGAHSGIREEAYPPSAYELSPQPPVIETSCPYPTQNPQILGPLLTHEPLIHPGDDSLHLDPSAFEACINGINQSCIIQPQPTHSAMHGISMTQYPEGFEPERRAEEQTPTREEPYAQLIYRCLKEKPDHTMVLREIYEWFKQNTERAKDPSDKGWQNSIRHNLSMNKV